MISWFYQRKGDFFMSEEKIKDRSTLGKEEFMEKYAIGAILSMSCYRVFLFRPMGIFSAMESKVVLWAFVIVCAFAARYLFLNIAEPKKQLPLP